MPEGIELTIHIRFAIALGLGFLLGLEREATGLERQRHVIAGVRTHSLISLYGFGCAWLSDAGIAFALPIGLSSIVVLAGIEYTGRLRDGHYGWTSSVAVLITFVVGALTYLTNIWGPLALGIISAILLSEKSRIESFVESLKKYEVYAILKFLVVSLLIFPLLPDREYTQFGLNPSATWKIVILISSIGFAGYFLITKFGKRYGLWLSGVLGGIVSSTAVSIAVGRIAQQAPETSRRALRSSLLASGVMYVRILVLVWIIGPAFLPYLWWKLIILTALCLVLALFVGGKTASGGSAVASKLTNPFEIMPAMIFALLFVTFKVVTNLVKTHFGNSGLILLSFIVGVTDIDPFILSIIHNPAVSEIMVTAVVISMMGNSMIKGIYFGVLAKESRREAFLKYSVLTVCHLPLVFL
jgi:uncharacterized membrane protein (DUF4010 family)